MEKKSITQQLRDMKPGDKITLPASAMTSIKACILTRLRRELIAEKRDWKVGEQNKTTGEYEVTCYTRDL